MTEYVVLATLRHHRQFDRFEATFRRPEVDDLKPQVEEWIGWRGRWEVLYIIEAEDNRGYAGQWACVVRPDQDGAPPASAFVWAPQCDLTDISLVVCPADQ